MPRTPENLVKHELIGLTAEVIESPEKSQQEIKGEVMDETQNTITISDNQIPKKGRKFRFHLDNQQVTIEGDQILERPADRLQ